MLCASGYVHAPAWDASATASSYACMSSSSAEPSSSGSIAAMRRARAARIAFLLAPRAMPSSSQQAAVSERSSCCAAAGQQGHHNVLICIHINSEKRNYRKSTAHGYRKSPYFPSDGPCSIRIFTLKGFQHALLKQHAHVHFIAGIVCYSRRFAFQFSTLSKPVSSRGHSGAMIDVAAIKSGPIPRFLRAVSRPTDYTIPEQLKRK